MNVIGSLLSLQNSLQEGKTQAQMIRTILSNLAFIKTATIYDVAELCYTSTASVLRLCNTLGYKSFSVFRSEISEAFNDYQTLVQLSDTRTTFSVESTFSNFTNILKKQILDFQSINLSDLEAVADVIHEKKSIHFFSHFDTNNACFLLQKDLVMQKKHVYQHRSIDKSCQTTKNIDEDSVALFLGVNLITEKAMIANFHNVISTNAVTVVFISSQKQCWDNADIKIFVPGCNNIFVDMNLVCYLMELLAHIYSDKYIGPQY